MIRLFRVPYARKNQPIELREYKIDGKGPVGTISEYCKIYKNENFWLVDKVEGDTFITSTEAKVLSRGEK